MTFELRNNSIYANLKDIYIEKDDKILKIFFGGNGDLYFDILDNFTQNELGVKISSFCISINDVIYNYFEELFYNILECNVFTLDSLQTYNNINLNKKLLTKKANSKLIQDENIVWYSDSTYDEDANSLKIEKTNDQIILTFYNNPKDAIIGFGIRFCNSGSKYYPFNICFMNLFNKLQKLEEEKQFKKALTK